MASDAEVGGAGLIFSVEARGKNDDGRLFASSRTADDFGDVVAGNLGQVVVEQEERIRTASIESSAKFRKSGAGVGEDGWIETPLRKQAGEKKTADFIVVEHEDALAEDAGVV